MKAIPSKVLVLGSDTRSFLSVVRSLGRAGLEVHSAWTNEDSLARGSRYLSQVHELEKPWNSQTDWVKQLNRLQRENDYQLIVPCNDQSIIPIRNNCSEIDGYDRYYILDDDTFEIVNSKIASAALAESLGIPTPRGMNCVCEAELHSLLTEFDLPLVLKPESSFVEEKLARKQTVETVRSSESLFDTFRRMKAIGSVQIQEHFQGVGTGIEFLASGGAVLRAFQHLRIHEPLGGGGSSYRKSIQIHNGMMDASAKLIDALNYSGVGMIEYLWDRSTDQWRFVEINGRFWGSLPLALASGADFPADLYRNRVQKTTVFASSYRVGVHSRNLTSDKNWLSDYLRSSPLSLIRKSVELTRGGLGCMLRMLTAKEHVDTFAWDDPKPFIAETARIVESLFLGAASKARTRLRNARPSRRRAKKRMRKILLRTESILFVCKGNICRSPFAEKYASQVLPTIEMRSAGYFPKSGRPSPENAIQASKQLGIDLDDHRSAQMSVELANDAGLIIVFDEENFDRIRLAYPHVSEKLHFLNHAVDTGTLAIADPFSKPQDEFIKTYRQIAGAIDAMASYTQDAHPESSAFDGDRAEDTN